MHYLAYEHPICLAHRGSTILWPENTLTAIQGAADHGCRYIETDLRMTRDGVVVLFHDHRLEALTNGTGKIEHHSWEDLRKLDAAYHFDRDQDFPLRGKGIRIPTLEEVLDTFPHMNFNIDLKQPGIEPVVAGIIRRKKCHHRVLIASFSTRRIRRCTARLDHPTATSAGMGQAVGFWLLSRLGRNVSLRTQVLQVPGKKIISYVDKKLISAAHASGLQVHVWTVNRKEEMTRFLELGVDGIVTDRIDILSKLVRQAE